MVLLISLGQLNGLLLKQLARRPGIEEIVVATRDVSRATPILNLARMAAGAEGFYPILRAVPFDFNATGAAAETLNALQPDVAFAAPSLQSWWALDRIPEEAAAPLRKAGFGAWLPFQLLPMIRLMTAWKDSGLDSPILSAPFPDVVNPILATHDLAPTCGVGNLDEMVPKLQWAVAEYAGVRPTHVDVWLVAHHALERYVYGSYETGAQDEPPPYKLHIEIGGQKLDPDFDAHAALFAPYPLPAGLDFQFLTVGSAVRLIKALLEEPEPYHPTFLHVPGPHGLPGGWPVAVSPGSVVLHVNSDAEWTFEEAIQTNRESHKWDGIESIEPDGCVVFTETTAGILRETLGYEWPRMAFDEVEAAAGELRQRFDAYVRRFAP